MEITLGILSINCYLSPKVNKDLGLMFNGNNSHCVMFWLVKT